MKAWSLPEGLVPWRRGWVFTLRGSGNPRWPWRGPHHSTCIFLSLVGARKGVPGSLRSLLRVKVCGLPFRRWKDWGGALNSFIRPSRHCVEGLESLGFSTYNTSVNRDNFISSFSIWMPFYFHFIALVRTFNHIFTINGHSQYLSLSPDC